MLIRLPQPKLLDFSLWASVDYTAPEPPVLASRWEDSTPGSPAEVSVNDIWLMYKNKTIELPETVKRLVEADLEDDIYQLACDEALQEDSYDA